MEYLPLFLLFMAALIAGWFYLQRAKNRDAAKNVADRVPGAKPADSIDESR